MKKSNLFLALIAVMMTACAAQNSEVKRNGACSKLTVSTYNSIFQLSNRYVKQSKTEDLVALHNACVGFSTTLETQSCKAEDRNDKIMELAYEDLEMICEMADLQIRKQLNE